MVYSTRVCPSKDVMSVLLDSIGRELAIAKAHLYVLLHTVCLKQQTWAAWERLLNTASTKFFFPFVPTALAHRPNQKVQ